MTSALSGRGDTVEAVRLLLTRPLRDGRPYSRPQPILVVEGPPGSGKTALLDDIVSRLDGLPYAYLRLGSASGVEVPQILSAVACQLARAVGRYDALTFPRLAIGVLACSVDIDGQSETKAGQRIASALGEHHGIDAATYVLRRSAGDLLQSATPRAHRAGNGSRIAALTRPRTIGRYAKWYAPGDNKSATVLDRLRALAEWSANPAVPGNRQRAAHLLWRAFVADVEGSFRDGHHADEWTMNCLILIDDVDSSYAGTAVSTLARVRGERRSRDAEAGDPLTMVVSSLGALLADLPASPQAAIVELPHWRADKPSIWLRAPMRDLTPDEVAEMAGRVVTRDRDRQVAARSVYRVTRGHPMATTMLLAAMRRDQGISLDLGSVLATNTGHRTPADEIITRLVGEVSEEAADDLVTLAAARNRIGGARLAAKSEMLRSGDLLQRDVVPTGFWSEDLIDGPRTLRVLLLRRLDARPDDDQPWVRNVVPDQRHPSWTQTFGWLRDDCQQINDAEGELYYTLAAGGFAVVVNALVDRLDYLNGRQWLDLLHVATSAPRRAEGRSSVSPVAQAHGLLLDLARHDQLMRAMAQGHRPVTVVADLVARLWVMSDPLSGEPLGPLHWHLAGSYQDLRGHLPDVPERLYELQREHQRLAGE